MLDNSNTSTIIIRSINNSVQHIEIYDNDAGYMCLPSDDIVLKNGKILEESKDHITIAGYRIQFSYYFDIITNENTLTLLDDKEVKIRKRWFGLGKSYRYADPGWKTLKAIKYTKCTFRNYTITR